MTVESATSTGVTRGADQRVVFDFEIDFSNGGGLQGQGFRLDVTDDQLTSDGIADAVLADCLVRDLRLLMVGAVRITRKRIIEEPHKRHPEPPPG